MTETRPTPRPVREYTLHTRMTATLMSHVDKNRRGWSRSEFVRQAVADAVRRGKVGPEPTEAGL